MSNGPFPQAGQLGVWAGEPRQGGTPMTPLRPEGLAGNRRAPQLSPGAMVGYLLCVYPELQCHGRGRGWGLAVRKHLLHEKEAPGTQTWPSRVPSS